jgi:hypothetical protein
VPRWCLVGWHNDTSSGVGIVRCCAVDAIKHWTGCSATDLNCSNLFNAFQCQW